jgi:tRNA pseudouridine38-40 synthase
MEQRLKLTLAYLGRPFHGWQRQNDCRTVQHELEGAIEAMTGGIVVSAVGAGRTDAGVHAAGQVAHIDLPVVIPAEALLKGLNQHLCAEIRIRAVRPVNERFHARKSARAKRYTYRVRWVESDVPWLGQRTATFKPISDEATLTTALQLLTGRHDMASFTVPEVADKPTVRTIFRAVWRRHPQGIDLEFVGDGFLRYQVRRMVAAVLEVARGRMTVGGLQDLIEKPQPGFPLQTAAARGLTLEHVYYRDAPILQPRA